VPSEGKRILLVEPVEARRLTLADRLRSQGYQVDGLETGIEAARAALESPPHALIADLWMPGVSGVQLCRLLRSELATESVPVILRGPSDTPRQRFWASRAGAAAYVAKGRIGELARALERATANAPSGDGFFQLHSDDVDIRDRISQELDRALYDSVLASEVRALSTCQNLPYLFDLLSQFLCEVMSYRWLAVLTIDPPRLCLHAHPEARDAAILEARAVLQVSDDIPVHCIEDEDAGLQPAGPPPMRRELAFGSQDLGRFAIAPVLAETEDAELMDLVARELGGPIRIVTLVEHTERLASHDQLTGIMNRRAFNAALKREISQAERLNIDVCLLLLDVDKFKAVNDTHGHPMGDSVLAAVGKSLPSMLRGYDYAARWGGEEFVVALPHTGEAGALKVAERIRARIEALALTTPSGERLPITASIGVAVRRPGEALEALVERADKAMYEAKASGRNRVVGAGPKPSLLALEQDGTRPLLQ
jgi:two-component system, cell cycle response regulator